MRRSERPGSGPGSNPGLRRSTESEVFDDGTNTFFCGCIGALGTAERSGLGPCWLMGIVPCVTETLRGNGAGAGAWSTRDGEGLRGVQDGEEKAQGDLMAPSD
uniref:Uncharacterized protein n=1 Tax=Melopsittacus undulatus TaxID=13146 RepID=A0A8V5GAD2_MELUD